MPSKLTAVNICTVYTQYSHNFAWREGCGSVVVFFMKLGVDDKGLCPEETLEGHNRESCLRKANLT